MLQPDPSAADNDRQPAELKVAGTSSRTRLGLLLIGVSGMLWFSLFAIPFLSLSAAWKTVLAGSVFVSVQITWWSGAALAGRETMKSVSSRFRKR